MCLHTYDAQPPNVKPCIASGSLVQHSSPLSSFLAEKVRHEVGSSFSHLLLSQVYDLMFICTWTHDLDDI